MEGSQRRPFEEPSARHWTTLQWFCLGQVKICTSAGWTHAVFLHEFVPSFSSPSQELPSALPPLPSSELLGEGSCGRYSYFPGSARQAGAQGGISSKRCGAANRDEVGSAARGRESAAEIACCPMNRSHKREANICLAFAEERFPEKRVNIRCQNAACNHVKWPHSPEFYLLCKG